MTETDLQKKWTEFYDIVPEQLEKVRQINSVATAFNTNIDAVLKISGRRIAELAELVGLTAADLEGGKTQIKTAKDVVRGIIKCFSQGIAEEWLCEKSEVYQWMRDNISYDRLQMGGQGGIVANAMAVVGVQKVYAHTNSHPALQAEQFLDLDNLLGFDENGRPQKAILIDRVTEDPLIHWIIEFDVGDETMVGGQKFVCPKSNRFIATYDPANIEFKIDDGFVNYLNKNGYDYLILSGYHNLTSERDGVQKVIKNAEMVSKWHKLNPQGIIHLELASTQDKAVRQAIIEHIAPLVDSIGLNEREALDALEVIDAQMFAEVQSQELTSSVLFKVLMRIKQAVKTPRIQLHMFGLYMTLQDKDFCISPEANRNGMMLAATLAATKCGIGNLNDYDNLLWAYGSTVSEKSLKALDTLAGSLNLPALLTDGVSTYQNFDIIAVPTILIDKPLTLVGMGDTISSVSLIGAR